MQLALFSNSVISPRRKGAYLTNAPLDSTHWLGGVNTKLHYKITCAIADSAVKINPDACLGCAGTGKRLGDRTTCQACDGYMSRDLRREAAEARYREILSK